MKRNLGATTLKRRRRSVDPMAAYDAPARADDEVGAWRLVVADHRSPAIAALDLGQPEQRLTFDVAQGNTGTLLGSPAMHIFLCNQGDHSVANVDPKTEPDFTRVELPFRRVDFILDPAKPQMAHILTEDGSLHRLHMLSAEIEQSARITQPCSMDGHWRDPRPRMALANERLILTDPLEATRRVIDTGNAPGADTIAVEGLPTT